MAIRFSSWDIVDLVSVDAVSSTPIPRDAVARCLLTSPNEGKSVIKQIIGSDYNIFCSKSTFSLSGEVVSLVPGFSNVNSFSAVWDPSTITMNFFVGETSIGSATVSTPQQALSIPLQGMIRQVLLVDGVEEPLTYDTIVYVYGYPLSFKYATWFDWTVRGDTEFPMAFALNANPLELNDAPFVATYGVLSGHLQSSIDTESRARVVVFRKDEPRNLFSVAQYQNAADVSFIGKN